MYWTFLVAVVCTFVLSYPRTDYMEKTMRGTVSYTWKWGWCL